ncbi:MAG: PRC and DUF2382 domain-containing protein [Nocardioidaceae bacterium]|nr:PRC and DUF2382 domain-containing protein [Nocardioidaceae bacterium]
MLNSDQINDVIGSTAYGSDGGKIGKVGQIYLDDQSGQPEWATVNTGLFGTSESFVPLSDASFTGDRLSVGFTKDKVKDAPNIGDSDGHLTPEQEQELYAYYGRSYGESDVDTTRTQDYDTTTRTSDVDDAMTVSEEKVNIGTRSQEVGRARLRKYVDTEYVEQTVPVRKERAVVEREPITDANRDRSTDGPEITEAEHEVVLSEETPVVEKTVEPVERVRLGTETVTSEETVSEEVRKERVDVDGDVDDRTSGGRTY